MTPQSSRKSLVQVSGGCLAISVISIIIGLIIGQYGIAFYISAAAALVLSLIIFYFAHKHLEENTLKTYESVPEETPENK